MLLLAIYSLCLVPAVLFWCVERRAFAKLQAGMASHVHSRRNDALHWNWNRWNAIAWAATLAGALAILFIYSINDIHTA